MCIHSINILLNKKIRELQSTQGWALFVFNANKPSVGYLTASSLPPSHYCCVSRMFSIFSKLKVYVPGAISYDCVLPALRTMGMAEIYFEDFIWKKGVYSQRIKKETQKEWSTAVRMQWRLKDWHLKGVHSEAWVKPLNLSSEDDEQPSDLERDLEDKSKTKF